MSQTNEQEQGAAPTERRARGDLELFWRIIAGLMVIIIGWSLWVLYQISPRSVVTPLVYESRANRIGTQQPASGAAGTVASPQSATAAPAAHPGAAADAVPQASPEAAAADSAKDEAQAAARSSADQTSAGNPTAASEKRDEQLLRAEQPRHDGLKLSPEITTPLVERKRIPKKQ